MWTPRELDRETAVRALVEARIAGPVRTPARNVTAKVERVLREGSVERFGLRLGPVSRAEVAAAVLEESAIGSPGREAPWVDPERLHDRLVAAGARLARAAGVGERVLIATGHPVGLM